MASPEFSRESLPSRVVMSVNPTTAQRGNQNKIHGCTIRHDSLFKAVWDWLILILVVYTAIEIPYTVAFTLSQELEQGIEPSRLVIPITPLHICNLWVDMMFIVDIFINFRSTFIDLKNDEIVSQPKKIALHYLKSWFTVDFFAAIPFELMVTSSIEGNGTDKKNTLFYKDAVFTLGPFVRITLMYAAVFGNMTAIIQRLYSRTSRFQSDLRLVEEFSKFHKIPTALREDLEEYFRHEWTYTKGVDLENILNRFPECLQADICHHLHKRLFNECSAFESADDGCLRALSIRFRMHHFLPGHYLVKQGDEVTSLYFIVKGSMQVIKDGSTVLSLGKIVNKLESRGDTISCDYGSLSHTYLPKANASLLVQSHTEVHRIPWKDLLVVLKAYPKFRDNFLNELELAYNLGDTDEEEGSLLSDNPSKPRVRRLSNARSTLQTTTPKESCEDTRANNGKVPGVGYPVECYSSREIVINDDSLISTVFLEKPPRCGNKTQADQMKRLESKLNNIEERLLSMDDRFNETLGHLMSLLKHKYDISVDTLTEDVGRTRTTSV
ncbi:hypothetical protein QZH41_013576 [Actinostola sp. cb2023]|nr:hypothetical protein QZH41_013576 [Actinostola sp. cb2023]